MPWSPGQSWGEKQISTAIYAAVTVLPLAGLGLGAVEFAHYTSAQAELRTALADGLAEVDPETDTVTQEGALLGFVNASTIDAVVPETVVIRMPEEALSSSGIVVTAEARARTKFLWVIGVETLRLRETAPAAPDSPPNAAEPEGGQEVI